MAQKHVFGYVWPMNTQWLLIDTPQTLKLAAGQIQNAPLLALDTEYDSFRYFREKLCLIQIFTSEKTLIIDPMAGLDLSFLARPFKNSSVVKIIHAAENDIRLLKRDYDFEFENIFDTHRTAMLLGYRQLSLETIVREFLNVELNKSKKVQRSRWDIRPLTDSQLDYAVRDVTLLPALYEKQLTALKEQGLEAAASEAFAKIAAASWQERNYNRFGHTRIKGFCDLDTQRQELLRKLFRWRFEKARETDCAIFMLLPDEQLAELVQGDGNVEEILPNEKYRRFGKEIEQIIEGHAAQ